MGHPRGSFRGEKDKKCVVVFYDNFDTSQINLRGGMSTKKMQAYGGIFLLNDWLVRVQLTVAFVVFILVNVSVTMKRHHDLSNFYKGTTFNWAGLTFSEI